MSRPSVFFMRMAIVTAAFSMLSMVALGDEVRKAEPKPRAMVGAYYFDGWAGRNKFAKDPNQPWAANAPTHLTRRMVEEFPQREPVWGWRDDSVEIMERQIDIAADNGVAFFAFCWYWHDNGKSINPTKIREDSKHTALELFLRAKNNHRMKFCLLVANHQGFDIKGADNWKAAAGFWLPYLTHKQYLTLSGKPMVIVFDSRGAGKADIAAMQEAARMAGLPGLAVAACGNASPADGYMYRTHYNVVPGYSKGSEQHKYAELVAANEAQWKGSNAQPYIPIVTAGWDKRPWEGPAGLKQDAGWYYPDRTPEQFADFLDQAVLWLDRHPEQATPERLILIYAWNELGEGGYIAPTNGDPDGKYLKAIRSIVFSTGQPR
jgi:hypothetical protein